jgi:hypothetical protein
LTAPEISAAFHPKDIARPSISRLPKLLQELTDALVV